MKAHRLSIKVFGLRICFEIRLSETNEGEDSFGIVKRPENEEKQPNSRQLDEKEIFLEFCRLLLCLSSLSGSLSGSLLVISLRVIHSHFSHFSVVFLQFDSDKNHSCVIGKKPIFFWAVVAAVVVVYNEIMTVSCKTFNAEMGKRERKKNVPKIGTTRSF